jgi:hypothetical protein
LTGIGEDPWAVEDLLGEVVDEREIVGEAGRGWEIEGSHSSQLTASQSPGLSSATHTLTAMLQHLSIILRPWHSCG